MPEYSCPKCGRALKGLQLPSFCEGCGQRLAPPPRTAKAPRFWPAFLTISEFLAFGLAVLARSNGVPFLGTLLIVILVNLAAAVVYAVWHRAVLPAAKEVEQHGLVGISKSFYQKILAPLLYGRSGARRQ